MYTVHTFTNCLRELLGLCEVVMTTLGSSTPAQTYSSSSCVVKPNCVNIREGGGRERGQLKEREREGAYSFFIVILY